MPGYFDGISCEGVVVSFGKIDDEYGWLCNMSPFPVNYEGLSYPTAEHLVQSLRFDPDQEVPAWLAKPALTVREYLRTAESPIRLRVRARAGALDELRTVEPMSDVDVTNMKMVLRLKIEQHDLIKKKLMWLPKDCAIVEDNGLKSGKLREFWGATKKSSPQGMVWSGRNTQGKIWEELRLELGLVPPAN